MGKATLVDKWVTKVRNHKVMAAVIVVGIGLIAVAAVVDAGRRISAPLTSRPRIIGALVADSPSSSAPTEQPGPAIGAASRKAPPSRDSIGSESSLTASTDRDSSAATAATVQYVITVLNPGERAALVNYVR